LKIWYNRVFYIIAAAKCGLFINEIKQEVALQETDRQTACLEIIKGV